MPLLSFFKVTRTKFEPTDSLRVTMKQLLQVEIARGLQNTSQTRAQIRHIWQVLKIMNYFNLLESIPDQHLHNLFTYSADTLSGIHALCNLLSDKGLLFPEYCLDIILNRVDASRLILRHNWKDKEINTEAFRAMFLFEKERTALRNKKIDVAEIGETLAKLQEARELFQLKTSAEQTSAMPTLSTRISPIRPDAEVEITSESPSPLIHDVDFDYKVSPTRARSPDVISATSSSLVTLSELLKSQARLSSPARSVGSSQSEFIPYELPTKDQKIGLKFVP